MNSRLITPLKLHQQEAITRIEELEHDHPLSEVPCAILAYECGDGKTLIGQTRIQRKRNEEALPTLVVCPLNTKNAWFRDAQKHFSPPLRVSWIGSRLDEKSFYTLKKDSDMIIINYKMVLSAFKQVCDLRESILRECISRIDSHFPSTLDKNRMLTQELEKYRIARTRRHKLHDILEDHLASPSVNVDIDDEEVKKMEHIDDTYKGLEVLFKVKWPRIICDEADEVRTSTGSTFGALYQLQADEWIAATASPYNNDISDIVSLFRLLRVYPPPGYGWNKLLSNRIGYDYLQECWNALLLNINTQRIDYKPTEVIVYEDFRSQKEKNTYENLYEELLLDLKKNENDASNILKAILRQRQACDGIYEHLKLEDWPTKILMVADYVRNVLIPRKEKAVLFTGFIPTLNKVAEYLKNVMRVPVFIINGSVPPPERPKIIARFERTRGVAILVATIRTINRSHDIAAANHTLTMNEWWNPKPKEQASGRIERPQQRRSVFHVSFIIKGSIEESIWLVSQWKKDVSDRIMVDGIIDEAVMMRVTSKKAMTHMTDDPSDLNCSLLKPLMERNNAIFVRKISNVCKSVQDVLNERSLVTTAFELKFKLPQTIALDHQLASCSSSFSSSSSSKAKIRSHLTDKEVTKFMRDYMKIQTAKKRRWKSFSIVMSKPSKKIKKPPEIKKDVAADLEDALSLFL